MQYQTCLDHLDIFDIFYNSPSPTPGDRLVQVGIDYVRMRVNFESSNFLINFESLFAFFGSHCFEPNINIRFAASQEIFRNRILSSSGARFIYNINETESLVSGILEIPGKAISSLSLYNQFYFLSEIIKISTYYKFLRVDFALDDFTKSLNPKIIFDAFLEENYTGFNKYQPFSHWNRGKFLGWTLALGSRQSDKYIRIYDTFFKHKNLNSIRFEIEFKKKRCELIMFDLINKFNSFPDSDTIVFISESMANYISDYALGSIDFIDRSNIYSNGSVSNLNRLNWWQDFINLFKSNPKKSTVPRSSPTLFDTFSWLAYQVSKQLLVFSEGLQSDFDAFLDYIFKPKLNKLKPLDRMRIEILKAEGFSAFTDSNFTDAEL